MCICIEKRVMEMKTKSKLCQKIFVFISIFFFFFLLLLLSKQTFQNYESDEITYLQRYILITDAQNFPDNS